MPVRNSGLGQKRTELGRSFLKFPAQDIVEASAYQIRHGKQLSITVELDGLDGRVVDHLAVGALTEMFI